MLVVHPDQISRMRDMGMNLDDYQNKARETAIYKDAIVYPALGLNGEAGEVAEKVKKMLRDDYGKLSEDRRMALVKEIGDVMWYLANLCSDLDVSLSYVAEQNLKKLAERKAKNKIQGDGDER